jgi:hypothetical protein
MTARRESGLAALAAVLVLFTAMLDPWASVILAATLLLVEGFHPAKGESLGSEGIVSWPTLAIECLLEASGCPAEDLAANGRGPKLAPAHQAAMEGCDPRL